MFQVGDLSINTSAGHSLAHSIQLPSKILILPTPTAKLVAVSTNLMKQLTSDGNGSHVAP